MAKKLKKSTSDKKTKKTPQKGSNAAENIDCLLELHNLQGVLLNQLRKQF